MSESGATFPDPGPNGLLPAIPDHELLRRIGRGSYGEVWLARNHTGTLRAVKIIRRAAFDSDRPYEREFTGLKNFEPLSREHEGLVDILQLGRNDAEGWFYSIMELAEDAAGVAGSPKSEARSPNEDQRASDHASRITDHAAYQPLTLEHRIRAEGRLPVNECLRIAATLADALRFLHGRGLVHRDIKPSNIIFVDGVPKLADVGLVARWNSASTFVGTEGFIPPEGPGTPCADLYSLGKCLYEMAMGKDRHAFPSPPTLLDELPDRAELLELNEVITKACSPQPEARYQAASAMVADLRLIVAGTSLQHSRRQARFRHAALVVGAVGLVCLLGWLGLSLLRGPRLERVREFPLPGNGPAYGAKLGNFDGGHDLELFNVADGSLAVVSLDGETLQQRSLPGPRGGVFELHCLADTDGDGRDEAFVEWHDGANLHLSVLNQNLSEIKRFDAAGTLRPGPTGPCADSRLIPMAVFPAASDQSPGLLASLQTGYSLSPRALLRFNFTNQTELWQSPFPAMPAREAVVLPAGAARFIIGTQSHNNGARAPDGTDDAHSYLYALSAGGQRLWTVTNGPEFVTTTPQVAKVQGTNCLFATATRHYELIRAAQEHPTDAWLPAVLKLDVNGRELARFTTNAPLVALTMADLAGRGNPVALITVGDGSSRKPELKKSRSVPES